MSTTSLKPSEWNAHYQVLLELPFVQRLIHENQELKKENHRLVQSVVQLVSKLDWDKSRKQCFDYPPSPTSPPPIPNSIIIPDINTCKKFHEF